MIKRVRGSARLSVIAGGAIAGVILSLALPGGVFAQNTAAEVRRISPDEAVKLAIENNLSLASTRVTNETKQRKSDLSWNKFIPSVDARTTIARINKGNMTVSGLKEVGAGIETPFGTVYEQVIPLSMDVTLDEIQHWQFSGNLAFALNLNMALFEQMNTLRLDYEGGLITYEKAVSQLERDVRKSYYQMLLVQENINLQKESYLAAERQEAMAQANYRAGLAPELTLLQAQVNKENLKPTIAEAENNFKLLKAQFAMNLGLPYDTGFEFASSSGDIAFASLDLRELISKAASGKPDIQELRHSIKLLESNRKATWYSAYTPNLSLSWNLSPSSSFKPFFDNGLNDGGMFSLTLSYSLSNLFSFSAAAQSLKDIDDNRRSLDISLAQVIRATELEIYNTILSLQKAQTQIEALQQTVALAQRSYELTEQAYRAGFQDLLQVQNAEQQLNQAKVGVLAQNFTYLQGLLDLEYAVGVPFGTLSSR